MRRDGPGNRPIRVLLLLSSLHGGGAERVAVHLLNRLDPRRCDVRMGLLRAAGAYLSEADADRLTVAPHGETRFRFDGPNRALYRPGKLLRGAVEAPAAFRAMITAHRPDVVVSFLKGTNLIVWRALAGLPGHRPAWIAREGNNVLAVIDEEAPGPLAARLVTGLTAKAYRAADRVLTISEGLASDIAGDLGLKRDRIAMIHNPLDLDTIVRLAAAPLPKRPRRPFLLATGRLEAQKAHDLLLRCFAASGAARSHDLVILGEGSRRAELEALAAGLGLGHQVHLPGFSANPFAWMAQCDLFVLPSLWEGFGTVLAEAQACGAPVLATDCRYGPRDIVSHGDSGWLVPSDNPPALTAAIARLLTDPNLRERLGQAGCRSAQRFRRDLILDRYAALFEEVASEAASRR